MIKIGFIDYYLDEWHANTYPEMLKKAAPGQLEVAYAYGVKDKEGAMTNQEWSRKYGVALLDTIDEVVEKSDALVVLAPDDCEWHEKLSQLPLRSGKPTYIDKTFAPDADSTKRMLDLAAEYGTPCYSTSALRFADEYQGIVVKDIATIHSWGPMYTGYESYCIHQYEPLMMLMNCPAKRVLAFGGDACVTVLIEFTDGRTATVSCCQNNTPFMMNLCHYHQEESHIVKVESAFFDRFINEMVTFFHTKTAPVQTQQTLDIMAVREASIKALKVPGEWILV